MEDSKPKPPEPEHEGSDVFVRIDPTPTELRNVGTAFDAGYTIGYRQGSKDAVFILLCTVAFSVIVSTLIWRD